jgi:hypothetical protein
VDSSQNLKDHTAEKFNENLEIFWKTSEEIELNYQLEVEKSQDLARDLSQAQAQIQNLEALLRKEKEAHQKTQRELLDLHPKVEKLILLATQVVQEHEKLKTVSPIRDLWTTKQLEVDRLKKSLAILSEDHPDRAAIQSLIQDHEFQRDELKWLLEDAERSLDEQAKRMDQWEAALESELIAKPRSDRSSDFSPQTKTLVPEF